ncbi:hypothetical protein SAMN05660313_01341 [Cellulophaga fucicola]|uniref:Uncharacterized protein n=1 Tax=Cellulophaga fucicola TaxID=76595 RepID=A0A1K1NST9_9FLAO|nr:hypothetical protein SAMN05660313_01341 [Cellulophaga fucicola]
MPTWISFIIFSSYSITLILALWRYPKYYDTELKYYPALIAYTLFTEILGAFFMKYPDAFTLPISNFYNNYNIVIYNIYNIVFFLYFFNLYKKFTLNKTHKKLIKAGIVLFISLSIINIFTQNILKEGQILTYITGGIILVIIILNYLNQIDWHQNKKEPIKNFMFWLSWGLLIFYSGYMPIKLSYHFRIIHNQESYLLIRTLHLSLAPIMYLCFIIGFLKMRRKLVKG